MTTSRPAYTPPVSTRLACALAYLAATLVLACFVANAVAFAAYLPAHGYPYNGAVAIWALGILITGAVGLILLGLARAHVHSRRH